MLARKWLDASISFCLTEANGLPNALIYLDKWPDVSPDVLYLFSFQLLINQEVVKWYWFVRFPSFCNQGPSSTIWASQPAEREDGCVWIWSVTAADHTETNCEYRTTLTYIITFCWHSKHQHWIWVASVATWWMEACTHVVDPNNK